MRSEPRLGPTLAGIALAVAVPRGALAEDKGNGNIEHTIIVGVGVAAEAEPSDKLVHPGGNVMVEWDAIEDWLEFELEGSVLSSAGGVQVPVALLVKKPFRLARWSEFMVGLGPEVVRVTDANKGTFFGGEFALDFMFWPSQEIGFWIEPAFDVTFQEGAHAGLGGTGGLLFGW
jgi:hypothetical protein